MQALLEAAAPRARLHVSVPNASHISLLRDLIVRGTFGYQPFGHRDATHIRWFTRRDIVALIAEAGWRVAEGGVVAAAPLPPSAPLTRGRSTEFLAGQWYVLGRRDT